MSTDTATPGNTVKVHYTGTLNDGTVFDTSKDRDPLAFEIGAGQVIPGFDRIVTGMSVGETRKETLPPEEAYGTRDENQMIEVPKESLPQGLEPEVGQPLQVQTADGMAAQVTVAEVKEEAILLDANHPLAGQDLTFEVELVEIA